MFNATTNNPALRGQLATPKHLFGAHKRFAVYATHTRFDRVEWQVADAETVDPVCPDMPAIIRQGDSYAEVMVGLE